MQGVVLWVAFCKICHHGMVVAGRVDQPGQVVAVCSQIGRVLAQDFRLCRNKRNG